MLITETIAVNCDNYTEQIMYCVGKLKSFNVTAGINSVTMPFNYLLTVL
jgi:hypothetical protein